PPARRRCDRPVGAGRSTALWAVLGAISTWARPANRYQDRHAVSRFSSQAGTQARPTVLPLPTARWRIVTDHPLSATSAVGCRSASPHTPCRLGAERGRRIGWD